MATNLVWFVPDFLGTALDLYSAPGGIPRGAALARLWGGVGLPQGVASIQALAIGANLGPNNGIFASELVPAQVGGPMGFLAWLENNLPSGSSATYYPYDWRQSVSVTGAAFAARLAQSAAAGFANYIVAHGMGALLAWWAWKVRVDTGNPGLIAKTITIGGALYGMESMPNAFRQQPSLLDWFLRVAFQQSGIPNIGGAGTQAQINDTATATFLGVARTWPGLYDLYPDPAMLDDPGDTLRPLLSTPSAWTPALVQPFWAVYDPEVVAFHTPLRQTQYLPPGPQVAHIVNSSRPTPTRVTASPVAPGQTIPVPGGGLNPYGPSIVRLAQLPGFSVSNQGDDLLTSDQAAFPSRYTQLVASGHEFMLNDPAVQALVLAMLPQTFVNPAPPPPVPLSPPVQWVPPAAPTGLPPFVFNSDPVVTTPTAPTLPVHVGADP